MTLMAMFCIILLRDLVLYRYQIRILFYKKKTKLKRVECFFVVVFIHNGGKLAITLVTLNKKKKF